METLLLYFGKVIISSGVMFLYYQLSLKDKTFHHYNRFYLLGAMVISLLLPLIRVDDFTIEVNSDLYMLLDKIQNFNTEKNIDNGHIYFRIIFSALGLVSLYFLGKLIVGIFKIQQLKKQFQKESFDGINFYLTDLTEAPFSYFKNLFWKNTITLNSDVGEQILKHEMVHIEQKHSFDKIFIEIITSVFWFNPFFHIIKKEISLIHEYLADKKAVKQSDTKAFAHMLLASHFSGTQLPATSPFLSSNLKKRLKMLQKPQTKFGYARRIFALPVLFSVAFAYMVNAKNNEIKETNIAIEEAVSQIKKDTVGPEKIEQKEVIDPKFFKNSSSEKKITELGKKIEEKSKVLKTLKPESKEFQRNLEEIGELSGELGKVTNSDDFKMAFAFSTSEAKRVNDFFKSDEWKNKTKALEDLGVEMPDLSNLNIDFPEGPPAPPTPPNAHGIRVLRFNDGVYQNWSPETEKEARKAMKEGKAARKKAEKARAEAMKLSEKARIMGEEARIAGEKARIEGMKAGQIGRFQGEAARVAGEKARIVGEKARLEGEKIRLEVVKKFSEGTKGNVYFYRSTNTDKSGSLNRTMELEADYIKKDANGIIAMNGVKKFKLNSSDNTKIFINGKEVSKGELDALNPENIGSVTINKEGGANIGQGEIRIQTKK
ncbi:M56 family metallopeptidase [Chryseobacterium sp. RP-3-3]|uniref:M56 family metallopeptidase n=1 Tax=Chryseobacterium antibioticum TaxID=2728847 RepID=A0A7Y0FRY4_9FLAO|nr:M56 family metallopeptidase [Chryseobacterium antibioticum]NML70096.1 M56 family metallopeptidase [Chryseobacterium antibioticum]